MTFDTTTPISATNKVTFITLFKLHDFRLLWLGQIAADISDSLTNLALMLIINHLTGSTAAMAGVAIALALPRITIGLLAGVYVDRLDRKKIMVISHLLRSILVASLVIANNSERLWFIYLIAFLQGSVGSFFVPARSALLPQLVPHKGLLSANSINQMTQILSMLAGTAIAGVLIGSTKVYWPVYLGSAGLFLLSAGLIARIRSTHTLTADHGTVPLALVIDHLKDGLRVILSNQALTGSIVALSVTMLGIGAVNMLMVPYLLNVLHLSETWFGLVDFSQTAGMVISGMALATFFTQVKPTRLLSIGLIGSGIGLAAMYFPENIWQALLVLFCLCLFIPLISTSVQTITQVAVSDDQRGRASATNSAVTSSASVLSMGVAGLLADEIGIRLVFVISGGFVILAGILARLLLHNLEFELPQDVPASSE